MIEEIGGLKPEACKTATPGMFCDVMVTINSGIPTLIIVDIENTGNVKIGAANKI